MNSTEFYRYRRSRGLCVDCGKPAVQDRARCPKCMDKVREKTKSDREFFAKIGICPRCKKNRILGDERRCPECRAAEAKYRAVKREENVQSFNAYAREYQCNVYAKRKKAGICPRCGKRKPQGENVTCGICLEKSRIRRSTTRRESGWREAAGICRFCDSPVKTGFKVCDKHYQMNIEKSRSPKAVQARREASKLYGWNVIKEADAVGE